MPNPKAEGLLPSWLRFVFGVVDSEDVPLSVSREHLQDQKVIQRISNVVTKRLLKEFKDLLKSDPAAYDRFFEEFGIFLKGCFVLVCCFLLFIRSFSLAEGICTDMRMKDDLSGLLRFESSLTPEGFISLDTYVDRMKVSFHSLSNCSRSDLSFLAQARRDLLSACSQSPDGRDLALFRVV